jgi:hypothetical protein
MAADDDLQCLLDASTRARSCCSTIISTAGHRIRRTVNNDRRGADTEHIDLFLQATRPFDG